MLDHPKQKQKKNNRIKDYLDAEDETAPLENKTAEELEESYEIEGDENENIFPDEQDTQSSTQSPPDKTKKQSTLT